jgi:hypothetical protein
LALGSVDTWPGLD